MIKGSKLRSTLYFRDLLQSSKRRNFIFYLTHNKLGIVYLKLLILTCSQIIFGDSKIDSYLHIQGDCQFFTYNCQDFQCLIFSRCFESEFHGYQSKFIVEYILQENSFFAIGFLEFPAISIETHSKVNIVRSSRVQGFRNFYGVSIW